jgi:serine/threonine protein kinase
MRVLINPLMIGRELSRLIPTYKNFYVAVALLYMSLEVWRDEKNTTKIDVYSVGLVFYEILTLEHPFLPLVASSANVLAKLREVHLTG